VRNAPGWDLPSSLRSDLGPAAAFGRCPHPAGNTIRPDRRRVKGGASPAAGHPTWPPSGRHRRGNCQSLFSAVRKHRFWNCLVGLLDTCIPTLTGTRMGVPDGYPGHPGTRVPGLPASRLFALVRTRGTIDAAAPPFHISTSGRLTLAGSKLARYSAHDGDAFPSRVTPRPEIARP
jgi:hypothetical protein